MTMPGRNKKDKREREVARGAYLFRVTEDILVAMEDLGVTKSELAKRLGKSKARISQLLSGGSNMTIGTLSDIAFELGLSLDKTFREYSEQRYRMNDKPGSQEDSGGLDVAVAPLARIQQSKSLRKSPAG